MLYYIEYVLERIVFMVFGNEVFYWVGFEFFYIVEFEMDSFFVVYGELVF